MKFKKLNSEYIASVNVNKYLIDWTREVSKPQKLVKDFLRPYWQFDHVLEEFVVPGSRLRLDVVNLTKRVVVEVSPAQHTTYNSFLHKKNRSNFLKTLKNDERKKQWCIDNNFIHIELLDDDIYNLTDRLFIDKFSLYL